MYSRYQFLLVVVKRVFFDLKITFENNSQVLNSPQNVVM